MKFVLMIVMIFNIELLIQKLQTIPVIVLPCLVSHELFLGKCRIFVVLSDPFPPVAS